MVDHKNDKFQLIKQSGCSLPLPHYCFAILVWHSFIEVPLSIICLVFIFPPVAFSQCQVLCPWFWAVLSNTPCMLVQSQGIFSVSLLSFLTSCLMYVQVHYWELGIPDCQGTVLAVPYEERLWWELRPRVIIAPQPFIPICETGDSSYGLGPNYMWMVWL